MENVLQSPVDAGKVRLAKIELLEEKYVVKEKVEDKFVKKNFFKRTWKLTVENRRKHTISIYFYFSLIPRDGEKIDKDEFAIENIETFTSVGSVYKGADDDLRIILESMRIEESGADVEIVPLDIDLGYTGAYSSIERTGMQVGKFFGKLSRKATDYFKENNDSLSIIL